ncbi:hypothetical protein [Microbacterium sp. YY-01]
MTERDIFFVVMISILATLLVVYVVNFVRSRRGRGRRGWWEGPWDDDPR